MCRKVGVIGLEKKWCKLRVKVKNILYIKLYTVNSFILAFNIIVGKWLVFHMNSYILFYHTFNILFSGISKIIILAKYIVSYWHVGLPTKFNDYKTVANISKFTAYYFRHFLKSKADLIICFPWPAIEVTVYCIYHGYSSNNG